MQIGSGSGFLISMLASFDQSDHNSADIVVKMDDSVPEEKSFCKMLELYFSSKLDYGACIFSITKVSFF